MVFVADAIVDNTAVMVKALDAAHASHAVDRALRPDASAEEAEVVEVSVLIKSPVQVLIEGPQPNRLCIPWVPAVSHKEQQDTHNEEKGCH
jgi:hypothetical protein